MVEEVGLPGKKRMEPWVDRRCCDWDTFFTSLLHAAEKLKFPLLLVNRCEARRCWRKYSCTGAEVIRMQRNREMNDALYNGYGDFPDDGRNQNKGGGSGPINPVKPPPVKPSALV